MHEDDLVLREALKDLAPSVGDRGVWEALQPRIAAKRRAHRRRLAFGGVTLLVIACLGFGVYGFSQWWPHRATVLLITDDSTAISTGSAGQTAPTSATTGAVSRDKDLFYRVTTMWTNKDGAAAREIFATNANLYWNWPKPSPEPASQTTGIEAISALVASGDMGGPTPLGDKVFSYAPSAGDIEHLTAAYDGARYITAPVSVAREIYLMTLEVRDGKVVNQFVEALY